MCFQGRGIVTVEQLSTRHMSPSGNWQFGAVAFWIIYAARATFGTEMYSVCSANRRHWPNVDLMLGQRRRRWPNIKSTLGLRWFNVSCLLKRPSHTVSGRWILLNGKLCRKYYTGVGLLRGMLFVLFGVVYDTVQLFIRFCKWRPPSIIF